MEIVDFHWFLESVAPKKVYYYCCKHPGCNYKTIRSGHLKRHERTHTKEKPFKCHLCSYSAARSDHLRRNIKIHCKNISAPTSTVYPESDSTAPSSPVNSPSPVISASSSPSLQPIPVLQQCPCFYLGNQYCDEGGMNYVNWMISSFTFLEFYSSVLPDLLSLKTYKILRVFLVVVVLNSPYVHLCLTSVICVFTLNQLCWMYFYLFVTNLYLLFSFVKHFFEMVIQ